VGFGEKFVATWPAHVSNQFTRLWWQFGWTQHSVLPPSCTNSLVTSQKSLGLFKSSETPNRESMRCGGLTESQIHFRLWCADVVSAKCGIQRVMGLNVNIARDAPSTNVHASCTKWGPVVHGSRQAGMSRLMDVSFDARRVQHLKDCFWLLYGRLICAKMPVSLVAV